MAAEVDYLAGLLQLDGKVALITGSRLGIGAATALGMARAGAKVAVADLEEDGLERVAQEVHRIGSEAFALNLDVRAPASVERAVGSVMAHFGQLDILVNNAGATTKTATLDLGENEWDRVVDTNLKGPFLMAQRAARCMKEGGGGRIINMSSTFARSPLVEHSVYGTSKAALEHMTRFMAKEWAPFGIRVNCIAPTTVLTETRTSMLNEEARRQRIAEIPLGRLMVPEDIVPTMLFLAGEAGEFVTGHTIYVDGGFTLR